MRQSAVPPGAPMSWPAQFKRGFCNNYDCKCNGDVEKQVGAWSQNLQSSSLGLNHPMVLVLIHYHWLWRFRLDNLSKCHPLVASQPAVIRGTPVHPPWLWEKNGINRKGGANTHFQHCESSHCTVLVGHLFLFFPKISWSLKVLF